MPSPSPVLVVGATGYVGGRLVPLLLESGHRVRAVGRSLAKIAGRSWSGHPLFEMVRGDVMDRASLTEAARGCRAAVYLVHSMITAGKDFAQADRTGAENMVAAAASAGMERIIYLGGLAEAGDAPLSEHLESRREVARVLKSGPVPCTDLRAAAILGSGSASFEILRYAVERFPVMLAPTWIQTRNQPISIRNVLGYLKGCLETDAVLGQTFDIGGPDILTYRELADLYAEEAGLPRRRIIRVALVPPRLASFLISRFSPVPPDIARPLVEGLRNESICRDHRIREIVPQHLYSCRETIRTALENERDGNVPTCWADAGCLPPPEGIYCGDAAYAGGTVFECGFRAFVDAPPERLWPFVERMGGSPGWYGVDDMWRLRGLMDRLLGGPGSRRARRDPEHFVVGDAVDCWRVLDRDPPTLLRLVAEMKLPGEGVLEFGLEPADGGAEIRVLARFRPKGLAGLAYWFPLFPAHGFVFRTLIRGISSAAGARITSGPERYTPKLPDSCPPPWEWRIK